MPTSVSLSTERGTNIDMEVEPPERAQEKGHVTQQIFSLRLEDENSTSVAYLQKIIKDPANAIVQHQIQGNVVKMLVILSTKVQVLIEFEIPKEDCTVHDLLDVGCAVLGKMNITFSGKTQVSLVNDPTLGINYIVEFLGSAGPGMVATSFDGSDSDNCDSSQEIVSPTASCENLSQNTNASDKNNNTSPQTTEKPFMPTSVSSSTERGSNIDMEVKLPECVQEKGHVTQQTFLPRLEDENSTNVAYLQKIINDPSNAIVQHQIQGNVVKILSTKQLLIEFEIPKEDCTVHDLLDAGCAALGKKGASSKPGSARTKDDNVDTSPLLVINNLKHQRVTDEQKLKVLKWNFTTPREEFVKLLKNLMTTANVNKTLRANMFHSDFRYHLKAIKALTEDIPGNSEALVSNLDLILKWFTLRFFDTNPTVLLKGLDYLQLVFNMLIEDQYHMSENEAASFIPYLIIKIGDPKNAVRNVVRALFKQMALVYPVSKLFSYVMEGLKTKNARQRTECLDQLRSLIENYGISVCQPSLSASLKEVVKLIVDCDNSVRNAVLDFIVQVYLLEGKCVFKFIGQISEENRSLLDKMIKRAVKNQPLTSASATWLSAPAVAASNLPTDDMEANYEKEQEEIAESMETEPMELKCATNTTDNNEDKQVPTVVITSSQPDQEIVDNHETDTHNRLSNRDDSKTNSSTSMQAKVSSFGLDMELQRIEPSVPVEPYSSSDLNKPPVNVLNPPKTLMVPISPSKTLVSKSSSAVSPATASSEDNTLDRAILSMASVDLPTAIQFMIVLENILRKRCHQAVSLQSKEDKFIRSIQLQLEILQTYPLCNEDANVSKGFRHALIVTQEFYATGFLGKNVSFIHLKELLKQIISLQAENKLEHFYKARDYHKTMQCVMMDIINKSNHTTIICVLIKLLYFCVESNVHPEYENLVMRCLCKKAETMSNWAADLDYDTILLEVHHFLMDYPTTWWMKLKSDTPVQVVKKILRSMARVKGRSLFHHLTLINNTNASELYAYLIKFFAVSFVMFHIRIAF